MLAYVSYLLTRWDVKGCRSFSISTTSAPPGDAKGGKVLGLRGRFATNEPSGAPGGCREASTSGSLEKTMEKPIGRALNKRNH